MHRSRFAAIVIDSQVDDINTANQFWPQALGMPYQVSKEEWASRYTHLDVPAGQPQVLLQKVSHESRVHIDIETDNIEAEVARLSTLGASVVERFPRWVVMQAPTGHKFCVVNPQRDDFATADNVNVWP
ncbi:VOC family protein [Pseudoalteromonas fenneropenaei]|uniref:VOC family protein n=1 Tax=Pseudoalteromonas fenneropenaei TaxID=1737459 RepID=A0ABV7CI29_9GAMM